MIRQITANGSYPYPSLLVRDFETLFQDFFNDNGTLHNLTSGDNFPKINMYKEGDKYVVEAGVSGWNIDDIEVKIDKRYLVFTSKRNETKDLQEREYFVREMKNSGFERRILIGDRLNTKNPEISYNDGVIRVAFTEDEEKRPQILKITSK